MSNRGLAKILDIDENSALNLIETFKARFPRLKQYIHDQIEFCRNNSFVETLKKRKRYLPNINSNNPNLKAQVRILSLKLFLQFLSVFKYLLANIQFSFARRKDISKS